MYDPILETGYLRVLAWSCAGHERSWGRPEEVDRAEMVIALGGVFVRREAGREAIMTPLTVAFANSGDAYRVRHPIDGGDRGVAVVMSGAALDGLSEATGHRAGPTGDPRLPRGTARIPPALGVRLRMLATNAVNDRLAAECLIAEVAMLAVETAGAVGAPRAPRAFRRKEAVIRGLDYLLANYRGPICVAQVARAAGYSMFHFSRVFHQETGVPVHRYVQLLRLRDAAERLLDGEGDLAALAYELGYSSQSHFTTAFSREFRTSPSALRRSGPAALGGGRAAQPAPSFRNLRTTALASDGRLTTS